MKIFKRGLILVLAILILLASIDLSNDHKAKNERITIYNGDLYYAVYELTEATSFFDESKNKERALEDITNSVSKLKRTIENAGNFFNYDYVDVFCVDLFDDFEEINHNIKMTKRNFKRINVLNQISHELFKKLSNLNKDNHITYYPLSTSKQILEKFINEYREGMGTNE